MQERELSGNTRIPRSRARSHTRIAIVRGSIRADHSADSSAAFNHESIQAERLITVDELAAQLNVPPSWIYNHTRLRTIQRIPHLKLGKYVRFQPSAVRHWLEQLGGVA